MQKLFRIAKFVISMGIAPSAKTLILWTSTETDVSLNSQIVKIRRLSNTSMIPLPTDSFVTLAKPDTTLTRAIKSGIVTSVQRNMETFAQSATLHPVLSVKEDGCPTPWEKNAWRDSIIVSTKN